MFNVGDKTIINQVHGGLSWELLYKKAKEFVVLYKGRRVRIRTAFPFNDLADKEGIVADLIITATGCPYVSVDFGWNNLDGEYTVFFPEELELLDEFNNNPLPLP